MYWNGRWHPPIILCGREQERGEIITEVITGLYWGAGTTMWVQTALQHCCAPPVFFSAVVNQYIIGTEWGAGKQCQSSPTYCPHPYNVERDEIFLYNAGELHCSHLHLSWHGLALCLLRVVCCEDTSPIIITHRIHCNMWNREMVEYDERISTLYPPASQERPHSATKRWSYNKGASHLESLIEYQRNFMRYY